MGATTHSAIDFRTFVAAATAFEKPMTWQSRLACGEEADAAKPETLIRGTACRSRLIDVPTGCGKTAGAVLAWLWNSLVLGTQAWPRRLVYCMPMRTLVEQTEANVALWLLRLALAATKDNTPERAKVNERIARLTWEEVRNKVRAPLTIGTRSAVAIEGHLADALSSVASSLVWLAEHSPVVLMGGGELDDCRRKWDLNPERPAIVIGTQDMLLSRALNRGYGMSRYRWPVHFGLLNIDCLWVLDEVQLMSSGLTTSLQLQAWREHLALRCTLGRERFGRTPPTLLSTHSWWMSATAAEHWLKKSVAMRDQVETLWQGRVTLDRQTEAQVLLEIPKTLERCSITLPALPSDGDKAAWTAYAHALGAHVADPRNRKGKKKADDLEEADDVLTIVLCNTVERAAAVYRTLRETKKYASQDPLFDGDHLLLLHSRFRGHERVSWPTKLNAFEEGEGRHSGPRIIIATQVVEAGVDISASVLYTELCPLASLIQRLGRCARRAGESGKAFWIDFEAFDTDDQEFSKEHGISARPYDPEEIAAARKALRAAESRASNGASATTAVLSASPHD